MSRKLMTEMKKSKCRLGLKWSCKMTCLDSGQFWDEKSLCHEKYMCVLLYINCGHSPLLLGGIFKCENP